MLRFWTALLCAIAPCGVAHAAVTPVLSAEGQTLRWTGGKSVRFVVESKPANPSQFVTTAIGAHSYTPPTLAGQTVAYRVRPRPSPKRWSNTVSISYAAKEPPPPPPSSSGRLKYRLDAASYYDAYAGNTAFMREHLDQVMAYPPFGDRYVGVPAEGVLGYHDAYTTFGAHALNPEHRATYVGWVKRDAEHGYRGTFVDDFEAEGSGQHEPGSDAELQALIEAIRSAIPTGLIELNMQPQDLCNRLEAPWLQRVLSLVDKEDIEFGAHSFLPWTQLVSCIATLHARGVNIDLSSSKTGDDFQLATYFLVTDGHDYVGSHMTPPEWTGYFARDLGAATSGIEVSGSTYTRHFTKGTASVNASTKEGHVSP